jgi:hypothetical protein
MSMSKKDYEAIAGEIRFAWTNYRDSLTIDRADLIDNIACGLARVFEADNERFSAQRFLAACRGEDSKDSAGRKVSYGR